MVKFCPECGESLSSQDFKFCPECGFKMEEKFNDEISSVQEEKKDSFSIYNLGERFEQVVEEIFQAKGYKTSRRQRLKGESGTINEIDVLAEKGASTIAVECKNLSSPVGQSLIRDFIQKLYELKIRKGYFASNSELTTGASRLAEQNNITVWTKDNCTCLARYAYKSN